ncbi:type IV toxin-antitoxin system AbiEi family antitoxin [Williamsia muralis]|uniref:Type IV toxin-antitoxin system AbiEi family antitoxin n=1 Tax=Williamsia marianensis TaxID=85044 RepID=A0ABU4EPM0_WILMA|nr:type IV toxin-antitoxin system AbiEi family antitoxin [Williamsia muralis]MDV7132696.1 type IV toxin-antitoxin system AbiEi family antitoxin [Williamsia muralis]
MDTTRWHGAVTRGELMGLGYTPSEIRSALRAGVVYALAPGIFALPTLRALPREDQHREFSCAMARRLDHRYVLGAHSAAVLHGLPLWDVDTSIVHLSLPTGDSHSGSRTSKHVRVQRDARPPAVMHVNGIPVATPARAVVDLARRASFASAVVTGDAALHRGLCTKADLEAELDLIVGSPGYPQACRAVAMMDGLAESPLESRSRVDIFDGGLPNPALQLEIVDARGGFVARVDFAWPEQLVVGEADGLIKYNRDDLKAVLRREKYRTDRITEQGWRVVRWSSADLATPGLVVGRLRAALSRPRAA